MANQVHQVSGVGSIKNRKRWLETDLGRVFPQQTSANSVEGPGPRQIDLLAAEGRRGDPLHSPDHFLGGSAGKRQQQDPVRINSIDDKMCNRWARVFVFPEPAPAITSSEGPSCRFRLGKAGRDLP